MMEKYVQSQCLLYGLRFKWFCSKQRYLSFSKINLSIKYLIIGSSHLGFEKQKKYLHYLCPNKLKTLKDLEARAGIGYTHNLTILVSFCLGFLKKLLAHLKRDTTSKIAGQTVKVKQTAILIECQCLLLNNKLELKMLA